MYSYFFSDFFLNFFYLLLYHSLSDYHHQIGWNQLSKTSRRNRWENISWAGIVPFHMKNTHVKGIGKFNLIALKLLWYNLIFLFWYFSCNFHYFLDFLRILFPSFFIDSFIFIVIFFSFLDAFVHCSVYFFSLFLFSSLSFCWNTKTHIHTRTHIYIYDIYTLTHHCTHIHTLTLALSPTHTHTHIHTHTHSLPPTHTRSQCFIGGYYINLSLCSATDSTRQVSTYTLLMIHLRTCNLLYIIAFYHFWSLDPTTNNTILTIVRIAIF